ncbi:DUF1877 family protein [Streptomyces sp. TRM66268-LWL]|uniref:DUF1877 family protein n=1 Tax=Streptomyces polyasparticus TaxID=2767826 RepID=A0ABR7S898_9ACTN|nr:DUF1877 family protein [Streptomyces polyasparticus]MBC9711690.1 DUF1877 family protein [Streptomyces polyasparticus]
MSVHMHLRAVAMPEIQDDHSWLAEFMSDAWDRLPEEYEAGVATSIDTAFDSVNRFYAWAAGLPASAAFAAGPDGESPWQLPVYGGRAVPHAAGADPSDPPMGLLEPPGVSAAADFLSKVSFDELWNAAGAELGSRFDGEEPARSLYREEHRSLLKFYGRAAAAGHAVVRVVWA